MRGRLASAVLLGALVGCGGNQAVKPQDDPEVLRKAEEAQREAAQKEGGNKAVKKKK